METLLELAAVDGRPVIARLVRQDEYRRPSLLAGRWPPSQERELFGNQAGIGALVEFFDASCKYEAHSDPWSFSGSDPWGLYVGEFRVGGETWRSGVFDPQIPWCAVADDGTVLLNRGPTAVKDHPVTLSAEAVSDLDNWLCREQQLPPLHTTAFERSLDRPSARWPRSRLSALAD
jgi:hypothetical protein